MDWSYILLLQEFSVDAVSSVAVPDVTIAALACFKSS